MVNKAKIEDIKPKPSSCDGIVDLRYDEYLDKCKEALRIIFEKNVDTQLLKDSKDNYEYNTYFPYRERYHLTKEEFKLLKEMS